MALDTTLGSCSAAVGDERRVYAARFEERAAGQAERLIPMIDEVLQEAGLAFAALTRIGVTIGPGSFTGTRIGLSAARALGLVLDIPVIGVTTLDALAEQGPADSAFIVGFDARREQIYVQMFDAGRTARTEPLALSLDEATRRLPNPGRPVVLMGSAAPLLAQALSRAQFTIARVEPALYPDAAGFVRTIAARGGHIPATMPRPLYLRPADAVADARTGGHAP